MMWQIVFAVVAVEAVICLIVMPRVAMTMVEHLAPTVAVLALLSCLAGFFSLFWAYVVQYGNRKKHRSRTNYAKWAAWCAIVMGSASIGYGVVDLLRKLKRDVFLLGDKVTDALYAFPGLMYAAIHDAKAPRRGTARIVFNPVTDADHTTAAAPYTNCAARASEVECAPEGTTIEAVSLAPLIGTVVRDALHNVVLPAVLGTKAIERKNADGKHPQQQVSIKKGERKTQMAAGAPTVIPIPATTVSIPGTNAAPGTAAATTSSTRSTATASLTTNTDAVKTD